MKQKLLHLLLCVMALATTTEVRADWDKDDLNWRVKVTSMLTAKDQYFTIEYPEENFVGTNDGIYNVSITTPDGVVFSKRNPNNSAMTTEGYGYKCFTSSYEKEENSSSIGTDARYRMVEICMKPVTTWSEYNNFTVTISFDLYIDKTSDNASPKTKYEFSRTFKPSELIKEGLVYHNIIQKTFTYSQDKLSVDCTLPSLSNGWSAGIRYSDPAKNINDNIVPCSIDGVANFDINGIGTNVYNTDRTFTVAPLAYMNCNIGSYFFNRYIVSDNKEVLSAGRRQLSNLKLTRSFGGIQLDWDITEGGNPGGRVMIKRRALGESFKDVYIVSDAVTTYYDRSVDPNTFMGVYSITYQGAYENTPDENKVIVAYFSDKPAWVLSGKVATLFNGTYMGAYSDVLDLNADKSSWSENVDSVVIDPSVASYPISDASNLFHGFSKAKKIKGWEYLNFQNVTNMGSMFQGCSSLTSLDLSEINTENVTDMRSMFSGCSSLDSLKLSSFNINKVKFDGMFDNCSCTITTDFITPVCVLAGDVINLCYRNYSGKIVDILRVNDSKFKWRSEAKKVVIYPSFASYPLENVNNIFTVLNNITSIEGLENLNLQNVTDMSRMFSSCSSLTSLDLSSFNTENVTDMNLMFNGCSSLTSLDLSSFNTENVTDMSWMFSACSNLTKLDLSSFNTENVTDMILMFNGCSSLTSLDLSSFNTENVTDMILMFDGCSSLTKLDLSSFNTENVTDMNRMFEGCSSLASLDLSSFNTENVTDMSYMFHNCSSLTSLNLASFSAINGNDLNLLSMFENCSNLKTIYSHLFLGNDTDKYNGMFVSCTSLKGAKSYDPSRTGGDMATFDGYFTPAVKGDINGDGRLSIADITKLIRRMKLHGSTYHYQADMDEDGKVTVDDLQLLVESVIRQEH